MKIFSCVLALIILSAAFVFEADAQTQRRKKTARRANTASVRPLPSNSARIIEPEVVSTAEEMENQENGGRVVLDPSPRGRENAKGAAASTQNQPSASRSNAALQREVNSLRQQIKSLREKSGVDDLEKLSLAEERADNFRRKLEEAIAREADLNSKLQQLDYQLRPESIQLETAVVGSTRPEEVREARRKMLESEKTRLREQINQVQITRSRLETAVANADSLVEKLRARVESDISNSTTTPVKSKEAEKKTAEATEPNEDEDTNPQF